MKLKNEKWKMENGKLKLRNENETWTIKKLKKAIIVEF